MHIHNSSAARRESRLMWRLDQVECAIRATTLLIEAIEIQSREYRCIVRVSESATTAHCQAEIRL